MNCIIYYSNTNQSKLVAKYFKEKLSWNIYDLNNPKESLVITRNGDMTVAKVNIFDTAVVLDKPRKIEFGLKT